jgi:hypothetical protein
VAKLLDSIFDHIDEVEEMTGEDAVERALEKALQNTTPERPGCPWDDNGSKEESS